MARPGLLSGRCSEQGGERVGLVKQGISPEGSIGACRMNGWTPRCVSACEFPSNVIRRTMRSSTTKFSRFMRGFHSTLSYLKAPFGEKLLRPLESDTAERRERGLVIVLPGIEGVSSLNHSLVQGLLDARIPYAVKLHDWTLKRNPAFINLWLTGRCRRAAAHVAELIVDYQSRHPLRPVNLIGHSGGGALIPYILEELPRKTCVQNAVLIAPAISPHFDLSHALERVSGRLVNFHSQLDWYFLGVGTTLVGTMDRRFGRSAGNCGFRIMQSTETHRQLIEQRFSEVRYHWSMLRSWHYGGHFSCMNRVFVERYIAPLLQEQPASHEVLPSRDLSIRDVA